jgi:type I restriction enzyme S subunit
MSHYKPYPAYRDSGVEWIGKVPQHWDVVRIKRTALIATDRCNAIPSGSTYIGLEDVESGSGKYKPTATESRQSEDSTVGLFRAGDVLYGKLRPYLRKCITGPTDGACSTEFLVLKPASVSPEWLQNWLLTHDVTQQIEAGCDGAKMPRTNWEHVGSIHIPMPDKTEQDSIHAALDRETARIDALIAKKTEFIELLAKKRQALITHAVTKGLNFKAKMRDSGVEWIGDVPEHWAVCKLSYRYSVELGKMLDEKKMTGNHPVPYLRNKDVQWQSINTFDLPSIDISPSEIDRYTIKDGDLLVCEGGDVGRAAIWRGADNVIGYQKALHRLRAVSGRKDSVEFYFYALFAAKINGVFEESDTKSTISHLPAEKFREYRFAFPPMVEQQIIVEFLSSMTKRIALISEKTQLSIDLLKKRRSALITAAVTGQIDLRESA